MAKKKVSKKSTKKSKCNISCCDSISAVYGLGFIGAAIYYISTATGFWMGVLGVLKAIVWPALVVFKLLQYLGM